MKVAIAGLDDMRSYHGKVTHLLSIIDPEDESYVFALGLPAKRRLLLCCHDVESVTEAKARERDFPGSRCIAPSTALVRQALDFARTLEQDDILLIHCGHGVSRSPALAFAILCQANPEIPEAVIFQRLLKIRPQSVPNTLIVEIADKLLKRKGEMVSSTSHP